MQYEFKQPMALSPKQSFDLSTLKPRTLNILKKRVWLDVAECALVTGLSRSYVQAVKGVRGSPFSGDYTTEDDFWKWWSDNHQTFRVAKYWAQRKRETAMMKRLDEIHRATVEKDRPMMEAVKALVLREAREMRATHLKRMRHCESAVRV